jgi:methylenetetrahydrofolate reductase (NADPH)
MSIPVSFEFFPPKTDVGADKLRDVFAQLSRLHPSYFSVTYGAGGSTRERTLSTIADLNGQGVPIAPHLSCVGDSKARIAELLDLYRSQGIQRLVALRGDLPSGQVGWGELPYAVDLVRFVREHSGEHFDIEVAAYPEMHPQAQGYAQDVQHLVAKFDAGANAALTQFFYNPDSYFHLLEQVQRAGVFKPIIPGIMPITNASNLIRFADSCGADVPRWIRKQLQDYGDDSASIRAFGHDVVIKLCDRLLAGGAPGLHFYTMNQTEPTRALVQELGLAGH